MLVQLPETAADAKLRAGFMLIPDIGLSIAINNATKSPANTGVDRIRRVEFAVNRIIVIIKKEMANWVKSLGKQLHQQIGAAAKNAIELLEKQGKLHPKNLKPLFDAFEKFKSVDFAGSGWSIIINKLEKEYLVLDAGEDEADFKSMVDKVNDTQEAFTEMLEEIAGLATESAAEYAAHASLEKTELKRVLEF